MLAGQPPFIAQTTLKLYETATTAPRPRVTAFRPELSRALDDWLQRALAIEARDRFVDMNQMWAGFTEALLMSDTPSLRAFRNGTFRG
jgi:hypothetical protein